ncbi:MAG TPA: branched-chain amino acid ABC transporter permease [Methylomirabilota bacterium]|nr:branched-chain amino acid ABC transporter permease [Methylomirabilota bacterium]
MLVLQSALAFAMACLALNLLVGYAGLLSLGHAAYFGIGAYAGAFAFTFFDVTSFELYLLVGLAAATGLAAVAGALCTRTSGMFFAISTLAVTQAVQSLFVSGAAFRPFGAHGKGFFLIGDGGLYLPRLSLAGVTPTPERFAGVFYYVVAAAFVLTGGALWRVVHSPFGLALQASRDNVLRATFVGVATRRLRWRAFVIAGALAGLAGALSAQVDRQVTPQQLGWLFSAEMVVATMLGGTRHFFGPVAGAFLVVALREIALRVPLYRGLVLGGLLIAVTMVAPGGLAGVASALAGRLRAWRRPAR